MKRVSRKISRPRALERALANRGRFGDSELAHVNPREKALLMALGGSGSRNPSTGFPEFFDAGDGVDGGPSNGDFSSEPGVGSSPGSPAPGPGEGDFSREPGLGTSPGAPAPGPGEGDFSVEPGVGTSPGLGTGPTSPVEGSGIPQQGWLERNLGIMNPRSIMANMDPRTPQGMVNALTAMSPLGAFAREGISRGTQALGSGINSALAAMGIQGNAPPEAPPSFGGDRFAGDRFGDADMGSQFGGAGSDRDYIGGAVGAQPSGDPVKYPTSEPGNTPDEIASFIGPGMSDLQQRALISTYGSQGTNSSFRTDPVKKYYARLLSKALSQDAKPYTLPVENLYWKGVLGRNVADPSNADQIRSALAGYL